MNRTELGNKDVINWYCSLRNAEHDHEHDGVGTIKSHSYQSNASNTGVQLG